MKRFWPSIVVWLCVCSSLLALAGCCTVFNSRESEVKFESEPAGASILIEGEVRCKATPCSVTLSSDKSYTVQAKLGDTDLGEKRLRRGIHPLFWVNAAGILVSPFLLIGFGVDYMTGKMWRLSRRPIKFVLPKNQQVTAPPPPVPEPEREVSCPKPRDGDLLRRIQLRFPTEVLNEEIQRFRGDISPEAQNCTRNRLWRALMSMELQGRRLDLDEAFSIEFHLRDAEGDTDSVDRN
jgi:hypothetical protein